MGGACDGAIQARRSDRQGQRWADPKGKGPPEPVALIVKLLEQNRVLEMEAFRLSDRIRMIDSMQGS